MSSTVGRFASSLLSIACVACGGGGGGSDETVVGGTISFPGAVEPPSPQGAAVEPPAAVAEVESNDSFEQAQRLPALADGARIVVAGAIGGADEFDGYALVARDRQVVEATLTLADASARASLWLYDPIALQFVAPRAIDGTTVTFACSGAQQLVVESRAGSSDYTLTIDARSIGSSIELAGLGDSPLLGAIEPGEALELEGELSSSGASRVRLSTSVAIELSASVGAGLEVALSDATLDLERPAARVRAAGSARASFAARGVIAVDVHGAAGARFALSIDARPTQSAPFARGALASLDLEDRALGRAQAMRYGEPKLEFVRGELLVAPVDDAGLDATLAPLELSVRDRVAGGTSRIGVELPSLVDVDRARFTAATAQLAAASEGVAISELNLIRRICATPNDTYYGLQWHYPLMQLPAAWDVTTGDASVTVAVIDTGETQHPDLDGRQVQGYDMIADPAIAADGDGRDGDPTDEGDGNGLTPPSWHGTHVAGTIGAESNNNQGVAGVTWIGDIMHVRVLGVGGGTDFDIAHAILYAANLANASGQTPGAPVDVINLSLGGPGSTQTAQNAITAARNAGVTIFAAAGNNNSSTAFYPASYNGVISISAVDFNLQKAPYSNFNAAVDFAAPGGDVSVDLNNDTYADGVLSTLLDDAGSSFNYVFYQGTSMACPHAAGVAALMIAAAADVAETLTPAEIETLLQQTAVDLGAAGKDTRYGHGFIDAHQAVLAAQNALPTTPVLSVATTSIAFVPSEDEIAVAIGNAGGGLLLVNAPSVSTVSGGNWLSAALLGSTSSSSNVTDVRVQVDRTGLAVGTYAGEVALTSNGGSATIDVSLTVQNASSNPNVEILVLMVDANDPTAPTFLFDIVNPSVELDWRLIDVPDGDYFVVAGSDDDNDDVIGGANDQYLGAWPTLSDPQVLSVDDGDSKTHVDFAVEDVDAGQQPGPSSSAPLGGRVFRFVRP